jgi:putative transposase
MVLIQLDSAYPSLADSAPEVNLTEAEIYLIHLQTHRAEPLFGAVSQGLISLNAMGKIAMDEWQTAAQRHHDIQLDNCLVMPTSLRGIVLLPASTAEALSHSPMAPAKPRLLSSFVAGFKAVVAKRVNLMRNQPGLPVWQRNYSEILVTEALSLAQVRQMLLP